MPNYFVYDTQHLIVSLQLCIVYTKSLQMERKKGKNPKKELFAFNKREHEQQPQIGKYFNTMRWVCVLAQI